MGKAVSAADAFRAAMRPEGAPDLAFTRRPGTKKFGFGVNVEQAIAPGIGAFARYGWSDGNTETWAFTQIDRSLSGGVSVADGSGGVPSTTWGLRPFATTSRATSAAS